VLRIFIVLDQVLTRDLGSNSKHDNYSTTGADTCNTKEKGDNIKPDHREITYERRGWNWPNIIYQRINDERRALYLVHLCWHRLNCLAI
jgi:hypothetical protein